MRRKLFAIFAAGLTILFLCPGWTFFLVRELGGATLVQGAGHVVRLHVLANSDDPADQDTKLKVRDEVIAYLTPYLANIASAEEAREVIKNRESDLMKRVDAVLLARQAGYGARVEVGWFDFPVKTYGDLVYPAGRYEAVRILLGKAEGKNWWCVLFPPLCFVDASNTTAVPVLGGKGQVKDGDSDIKADIKIKWKIVELLENYKEAK